MAQRESFPLLNGMVYELSTGRTLQRDELHELLGGGTQEYLPTKNGRVVCGCFRPDANPDAPMIVLPGFGEKIERTAEIFANQGGAVPIFLKRAPNSGNT